LINNLQQTFKTRYLENLKKELLELQDSQMEQEQDRLSFEQRLRRRIILGKKIRGRKV